MPGHTRKPVPGYVRYPVAGVSGMGATLFVHPMDVVKFRMQLSGEGGAAAEHSNWRDAFKNIIRREGFTGLYRGISANLFHQAVYTTTRMGTYQMLVDKLMKLGREGLTYQIPAAMTGGLIAGSIGTPADVVLVRMLSDGRLPPSERRHYRHVFDALRRIYAEEGTKGLFTGLKATIIRSMTANVSQLVSYTQTKSYLLNNDYMKNDVKCHIVSSLVSGYAFAMATCPIDVMKTRIQFMELKTKTPLYSGILDAIGKTVRKEGVTALWKGFTPMYARCAPHTLLLFIFSEHLTYVYRKRSVNVPGSNY